MKYNKLKDCHSDTREKNIKSSIINIKFNNYFLRNLYCILLVMIISLILLSSISFATDGFYTKKITFRGDGDVSEPINNQKDEDLNFDKLMDTDALKTNITANIINNSTINHVLIEVKVFDINNNLVNNGSITLKNQNDTLVENVIIENGTALIDLSVENSGYYELLIVYNPSDEYEESQSIISFNVENDNNKSTSTLSDNTEINQKSHTSNNKVSSDSSKDSFYIGNVNTGKFHGKRCSEVSKIHEGNKVYFNSREEAINSGFKPCKKCKI